MVLDQIRHCFLFSSFSEPQLEEIFRLAREQTFLKDQMVTRAQQPYDSMWIVIEGSAELENSKKSVSIKSGDVFGEHCLLGEEPAPSTIKATELLRTLRFRKSDFTDFFKRHPDCEKKVMNNLASRK